MAYYSDPAHLFPGYATDEGTYAAFPAITLPTCSGNPSNINDIKEVLFSLLSVIEDDYAALPAYSSGVFVQTKAKNFSISSQLNSTGGSTMQKIFIVTFVANAPLQDVADENEYNPD
jgi:hypothetical protein